MTSCASPPSASPDISQWYDCTHSHAHTLTHTHTHTLKQSQNHTHTSTHTLTHSLAHTHSHTLTHTLSLSLSCASPPSASPEISQWYDCSRVRVQAGFRIAVLEFDRCVRVQAGFSLTAVLEFRQASGPLCRLASVLCVPC